MSRRAAPAPRTLPHAAGGDSSGLPVSVRPFPEIPSRLAVRTDFPMSKYCSHGILLRFSLLCVDVSRSHVNETASSLLPTESSLLPPRSALGLSIARRLAPSGFCSSPTPSYAPSNDTVDVLDHRRRRTIGRLLQHRPFSGLVHSAGELLHTPWPIPTSMATALLSR